MLKFTELGLKEVETYIKELEAKRKEILDAGKDTADETDLPTPQAILQDIPYFEENGTYWQGWGVTDNYESDYALLLERGKDYEYEKEMKTYAAIITETFNKRILVKAPSREEANRLLDAAWYGDLHTESCNKVLFDYHGDDSDHTMYLDEEITENLPEEYEDLEVLELNPERDNFAWRTN